MGGFWKKLSPELFHSALSLMKPTPSRVIASLDPHQHHAQDGVLSTYLHRFFRSINDEEMLLFLRFTTGSMYIVEGEKIKVEFISSTFFAPKASTCFKILVLPRYTMTFCKFRDLFLTYST